MNIKAYISPISPWWTEERQLQLLAERVDGWNRALVFRDDLTLTERRAHRPEALIARAQMLRPTQRRNAETIYVASLAVLAWSEDDYLAVLHAATARNAMIVAIDENVVIQPHPKRVLWTGYVDAWKAARTKSRLEGAARRGAAVSAERRLERSKAGIEKIKRFWALPSKDYPMRKLEELSGLSWNTIKAHMPEPRAVAQHRRKQQEQRKAKKQ